MIGLIKCFTFLYFIIAAVQPTSNDKIDLIITDMSNNFNLDSTSIHNIWELKTIKVYIKGMGGIDNSFKTLDLLDREKTFVLDDNNRVIDTIYYKVDNGNLVFFYKKLNIGKTNRK